MGDVEVGYGDSAQDTAVLLLAAAEDLDLEPSVVRTAEGKFVVPEEVAKQAGLSESGGDEGGSPTKAPAKKTAKKTATEKKDD